MSRVLFRLELSKVLLRLELSRVLFRHLRRRLKTAKEGSRLNNALHCNARAIVMLVIVCLCVVSDHNRLGIPGIVHFGGIE